MTEVDAAGPLYQQLLERVLGSRAGLQQIWFEALVLDKYRGAEGYQILRTDSAGRLRKARLWSVDFGIVDGEAGAPTLLHLPAESLGARLPAVEREHWQAHAVAPPTSDNFLRMQLHPEACIDDGEIRRWDEDVES